MKDDLSRWLVPRTPRRKAWQAAAYVAVVLIALTGGLVRYLSLHRDVPAPGAAVSSSYLPGGIRDQGGKTLYPAVSPSRGSVTTQAVPAALTPSPVPVSAVSSVSTRPRPQPSPAPRTSTWWTTVTAPAEPPAPQPTEPERTSSPPPVVTVTAVPSSPDPPASPPSDAPAGPSSPAPAGATSPASPGSLRLLS